MISRRSIFGFALVPIAPVRAVQPSKLFLAPRHRAADPVVLILKTLRDNPEMTVTEVVEIYRPLLVPHNPSTNQRL